MLLHICCAPCVLPIVEHLLFNLKIKPEDLVLYFYNPNIFPEKEYKKRLAEVEKMACLYHLKLYQEKYNHQKWLYFLKQNLDKPLEEYPENSFRCLECFKFRLNQTALFVKTHGFKEFATTLSVSRYKDVKFINQYAESLAKKVGLEYKTFSLDPKKTHQKGIDLSKKYGVYRQKYCGCEFSLSLKQKCIII